jgi:dihydroorotate dehydrogenase
MTLSPYRSLLAPVLFALTRHDPEEAHRLAMQRLSLLSRIPALLALVGRVYTVSHPALERRVFGVRFPNPVGLAAGFDKDGEALPALAALGFGFLEVGTVTWHAQPGNSRPRIFRMPAAGALINRMGFNNEGAAALATRLAQMAARPVPIGISLGKSRRTPLEEAIEDYCASFRALAPYGDFFTVNVSSPNTPGLRTLQDRDHLDALLAALRGEIHNVAREQSLPAPPLLVKIAPDLSEAAISEVLTVCADHAISGIIATNTTRVGDGTTRPACETGGLSGRPLAETARRIVRFISRETDGRLPIIGVGGIVTPDDARRMLDAGAALVQVYTGFIYQGPGIARTMNRSLMR